MHTCGICGCLQMTWLTVSLNTDFLEQKIKKTKKYIHTCINQNHTWSFMKRCLELPCEVMALCCLPSCAWSEFLGIHSRLGHCDCRVHHAIPYVYTGATWSGGRWLRAYIANKIRLCALAREFFSHTYPAVQRIPRWQDGRAYRGTIKNEACQRLRRLP